MPVGAHPYPHPTFHFFCKTGGPFRHPTRTQKTHGYGHPYLRQRTMETQSKNGSALQLNSQILAQSIPFSFGSRNSMPAEPALTIWLKWPLMSSHVPVSFCNFVLLTALATSVDVERLLSSAGHTVSERRHSLLPTTTSHLVTLGAWSWEGLVPQV